MLPFRPRRILHWAFQQPEPEPESEPRFPTSVQHVHTVIAHLRRAFGGRLPDELVKRIVYLADYDCLHFTAASTRTVTAYGGGRDSQLSVSKPYIETEPLSGLSSSSNEGRIRSFVLCATGRDQGFVNDPSRGSWSWLEVRQRRAGSDVSEGLTWARNSLAEREWQNHELVYHVEDEGLRGEQQQEEEGREEIVRWIRGLRNGDRISIVPMAQYRGWQCRVQEASIDVEIEVWR